MLALMEATRIVGCVIVACLVIEHPFESVTVTTYAPTARLLAVADVCIGFVFHEYVYGPTPPVADTVALPSVPLLQLAFITLLMVAPTAVAGWVMVTDVVTAQPLLSVTVTV